MTNTIVVEPASRPLLPSTRRGAAFGIAALVFSLITAFWSVVVWAIGLGTSPLDSAYGVAIVFFIICAIVGLVFFVATAVTSVLALIRNGQLGVICGAVGAGVALGALCLGVLVAMSIAG